MGSCGGYNVFFEYWMPFHGERQPLRPQRRPAPLTQGSQGGSCGRYSVFSNIGLPFTGNGNPSGRSSGHSPLHRGAKGLLRGNSVFFEYWIPFHGERHPSDRSGGQLPLRRGARGAPAGGDSVFFEYRASFHGGTATPQAAAAASSPCTGEPRGIHAGDPVQKRVSGGEPLGALFFDLRQRLFGYCKNTSPHPRRR